MPLLFWAGLFVSLIAILSYLRQAIVYEIAATSLILFGSRSPGIIFYSVIFLPGTIIHELSHWIVAEILRVPTGEITILPSLAEVGDTQRLGSVRTGRSDPFRGFLIGIAPFISGLLILFVLGQLLAGIWGTGVPFWQLFLLVYGIIVIGNSMMVSKEDRRTWPFIIIFLVLILIVVARMQLSLPATTAALLINVLSSLSLILGVTTGFNLVMIGGSYIIRLIAQRVTGKRLMHK